MKPTPEQIAAAKDELRNQCEPKDHHLVGDLIHFVRDQNKASNILLAALEAAEADGARLDWLEKAPASTYPSIDPDPAIGLMHFVAVVEDNPHERRGHLGKTLREAIDAARKKART